MANTQPSSAPSGDEAKDANGNENHQETEIFEDTLVVDGPFTETGLENLDLNNTEIVEDSEPVEDMITGITCEYETEVVLDSEDEEMNNTGKVTVGERFLQDKSSPAVNNSSVLFKKRLPKLPCEQANSKSNATACGKSGTGDKGASIDAERFDDNNHQCLPAMSYDAHSPTVAALGFVDQYLSSIDVDLFQGFQNGKTAMEKSPQVSSARGSISLAKKFKARTQNEDKDPFKWADSNQNLKEAGIFCKKHEASFNFGSHGLTYKRRSQKKGSRLQNQGKCGASNGCDENQGNYSASYQCDENLVQEPTMAADSNNSLKELYAESCAARDNVDIYSSLARTEDMSDIGLDTQIAAEAMDALANLSPAGFHFSDTHQPEKVFDASLSYLKQAHQKNSSFKENPGSHSIALKSDMRNVSSCRFSKVTSKSASKQGKCGASNGCDENQGNYSASNRCDENLVQEPTMAADSNNSLKELYVESCAARDNVDIYSSVARTEDMSDIGLDTQIAAEAMDALANLSPAGFHFSDTPQPEKVFDASLSDLKQAHQKNSSFKENPGSHSIALKSDMLNVSSCRFSKVTSKSASKQTYNQDSNLVSGEMEKIMGSKLTIEGEFKNITSSSICSESVSHEEVCLRGEGMIFQPASKEPKIQNKSRWKRMKHQPSHSRKKNNRWTRMNHRPSHPREKNNNVEEDTIKYKRKGKCLVADPVVSDVKAKRLSLSTSSYGVARKSSLNHQVEVSPQISVTSSFSKIDSWDYPKGPRGKRKRANAPRVLGIDDKENNFCSTRSLEGRNAVRKSCLLPVSAGDAIKFENLHDMRPLLLAHVEILSNKSVVQSSSEISASVAPCEGIKNSNANHTRNEHRKKACEKNLPKSSLLKELSRLGVPKSTSEMMSKDLRHRRDMTNVRVLFSQHLDDNVLKQQQKILARLNISTASNSMEATHFIADKFARTKNMLEAMALGNLVLTHSWLESCGQANFLIDEKNYVLRDMKKEKEIGFSMPVSLARARQKPLLKGKRVYITPHIKPNKEVVASLVTAVHGQLVDENQIFADKNDNILDDLLILSCEEDFAICRHFLKRGAAIYSSELVLNGIIIQKLELERHKLFANQVTKNKLGRCNWFGKVYRRRLRPVS